MFFLKNGGKKSSAELKTGLTFDLFSCDYIFGTIFTVLLFKKNMILVRVIVLRVCT